MAGCYIMSYKAGVRTKWYQWCFFWFRANLGSLLWFRVPSNISIGNIRMKLFGILPYVTGKTDVRTRTREISRVQKLYKGIFEQEDHWCSKKGVVRILCRSRIVFYYTLYRLQSIHSNYWFLNLAWSLRGKHSEYDRDTIEIPKNWWDFHSPVIPTS